MRARSSASGLLATAGVPSSSPSGIFAKAMTASPKHSMHRKVGWAENATSCRRCRLLHDAQIISRRTPRKHRAYRRAPTIGQGVDEVQFDALEGRQDVRAVRCIAFVNGRRQDRPLWLSVHLRLWPSLLIPPASPPQLPSRTLHDAPLQPRIRRLTCTATKLPRGSRRRCHPY